MSWGPEGLVFGQGSAGILRVSPTGGQPERLVTVNEGEVAHDPQILYVPSAPAGEDRRQRVSSSRAAGRIDKAKKSDDTHVALQIFAPELSVGPGRILKEHLPPKVVGDAQSFQRTEPVDALGPVAVLAVARSRPVPRHELADATRYHWAHCTAVRSLSRPNAGT